MPGAKGDDPELRRQVVSLMARRAAEHPAPRRFPKDLRIPVPATGRMHEIRKKLNQQAG